MHRLIRLAIAKFGRASKLLCGRFSRNPVDPLRVQRERKQLVVLALLNDQQVALEILADDKPAFAAALAAPADAKALSLAERVVHQPIVTRNHLARFVDHVARLRGQILH
ncbi:hypothetical protein SDC9_128803 [bioreactor metagenome]|uniref:Uncharacterized protein n=1 Tax=bioreactor metagenome TaxID=1076179 RepID=A0A645CX95_9ZZZZ